MKGSVLVLLFAFICLVFPSTLPPAQSSPSLTKQVIVHCRSEEGFGDYAGALFMAMKFKEKGFRVYLLMKLSSSKKDHSNDKEIDAFFKIFEPSFESLYNIKRSDLYFYLFERMDEHFESAWKHRLFSEDELYQFLPLSSTNPGVVYGPCARSSFLDKYYSNNPRIEFAEFSCDSFSLELNRSFSYFFPGIYIYDQEKLEGIADTADREDKFVQQVTSFCENGIFYFSYFNAQITDYGKKK